jgi:hypothetical protein
MALRLFKRWAGIHAQTPEIYAQGGMDIRTGGGWIYAQGSYLDWLQALSKAEVYVGTFSNKLSEKVLASTSLSKM